MRRTHRFVFGLACIVAIGACANAADTPLAPEAPASLNGGYATGGNRSDDDDAGSSSVQSDTTGRNGGYATGGN